jgi:hypothetical protein
LRVITQKTVEFNISSEKSRPPNLGFMKAACESVEGIHRSVECSPVVECWTNEVRETLQNFGGGLVLLLTPLEAGTFVGMLKSEEFGCR